MRPVELVRLMQTIGIVCIEHGITWRYSPLRIIAGQFWAKRLTLLRPHFDPAFYLSQFRSLTRKRAVAREPLLHYCIIGWREGRAPNNRFEPRFFREDLCPEMVRGEPLSQLIALTQHQTLPQNEVEASAKYSTPTTSTRRALIFHHARGGGSSKFLAIFERRLQEDGIEPIRLRPINGSGHLVIWPAPNGVNEVYDLANDMSTFLTKVATSSIDTIVASHVIDLQPDIFKLLRRCVAISGAALWVILHDYYCLCPRVNLVDAWHQPCVGADPAICDLCVASGGGEIGSADPTTWRREFISFLSQVNRIIAPSNDAQRRLSRFIDRPIETWFPETDLGYPPTLHPTLHSDDRLRVAILGNLNRAKGSHVVLELARLQSRIRARVEFTVFGASNIAGALRRSGVSVRGRYAEETLVDLLTAYRPHLILLPAIWPETWSFVLTHALSLGLPVMAFAHGAQDERLKTLQRADLLLPLAWVDRPDLIFDTLLKYRAQHVEASI